MKAEQERNIIWLFSKINQSTTKSMESSRRDLSIDMAVDGFICKNNQKLCFHSVLPQHLEQVWD